MTAPQKQIGQIKWFDVAKGYGFISTDRGDIFVHASACSDAYPEPCAGDNVSFVVEMGKDGRQSARRISIVKS
jgi:cold shock protein